VLDMDHNKKDEGNPQNQGKWSVRKEEREEPGRNRGEINLFKLSPTASANENRASKLSIGYLEAL